MTLCGLLALAPALARAQELPAPYDTIPLPPPGSPPAEEPTVEIETIVVIGEKLDRSLDQTATSTSVTTGRQPQTLGVEINARFRA